MMLTRDSLSGFVSAMVTPFTVTGEIMEDAFRELTERLIACGTCAICVAGDNGEAWTLSLEERRHLTGLAVAQAAGRVPILAGCTAPGTPQTIANARAALEGGADGLLVMPQTYVLKATRDELVRRFAGLAEAVDLPFILYHSPRRSGIELRPADIEALVDVAPIIGVKESHRDFFHLTHMVERFRDRVAVLVGPGHYIYPGLAIGAPGFFATGPELLGAAAGRIVHMAKQPPGPEQAALHFRLTRLYELLMGVGTWPAAWKAALNLAGFNAGYPREPVLPLAGRDLETVKSALIELELLGPAHA